MKKSIIKILQSELEVKNNKLIIAKRNLQYDSTSNETTTRLKCEIEHLKKCIVWMQNNNKPK